MNRYATGLVLVVVVLMLSGIASAANLEIGQSGIVTVEFSFSDAAFTNTLALADPPAAIVLKDKYQATPESCGRLAQAVGLGGLELFSETETQRGCRIILDYDPATDGIQPFPANAELEFANCVDVEPDGQCNVVWSTDDTQNIDGCEHARFTRLYANDPNLQAGEIWQMKWEDLNIKDFTGFCDPDFGDFNDVVAVIRVGQLDQDGDGLWDDWELHGIDTDGDTIPDFQLEVDSNGNGQIESNERADYRHKDIFLEIDYLDCTVAGSDCSAGDVHTHRFKDAAKAAIVQAFDVAPVSNPDGVDGITLHVDVDQALPHMASGYYGCNGNSTDFDDLKTNPSFFQEARRYAFHYALFAHQDASQPGAAGCGDTPGADIVVTMSLVPGDFDGDGLSDEGGTVQGQAATLMHELGHNLELLHGGDQRGAPGSGKGDANYKPNYFSVMNYSYSGGIRLLDSQGKPLDPDGSGPLEYAIDYSDGQRPTLDETMLDETAGVGTVFKMVRYNCPNYSVKLTEGHLGKIDWNCDSSPSSTSLVADINRSGICVLPGTDGLQTIADPLDIVVNPVGVLMYIAAGSDGLCQTTAAAGDFQEGPVGVDYQHKQLTDFNDWAHLRYDFQSSGAFTDVQHLFTEQEEPPTESFYPAEIIAPEDVTVESDTVLTVVDIGSPTVGPFTQPPPTVTNDAPSAFPFGTTIVTWTAVDESQNVAVDSQEVTVIALVDVDIKYGSDPNCINRHSRGSVPVAVLGGSTVDAAAIEVDTIEIDRDEDPATAGVAPTRSSVKDVNGDGADDLILHFRTAELDRAGMLADGQTLFVTGELTGGVPVLGSDRVYLAGGPSCE